ncbi:MAG TPA: M50 family metallopeptidase [Clostridiaceae bacterium]|nr:M50 family metallopeptidase [Clostridiaceae bacterium]
MKQTGRYLLILLVVIVLWNTTIIKPLKLFAVFLHELGHAFMALVFGYGIQAFKVNLNESGYVISQSKGWFSSFMIANGGYLGSVFFALLILYLKRTRFKKLILGSIAIILLTVSIKFSGFSFTLLYSIIFAVFVLALYMIQNEKLNDWVIDIFGIVSVAYAIYDTFVDTILLQINLKLHLIKGWKVEQPLTDAAQLAEMTHIPALVWGIIWLCISIFAVNAVLLKGKSAKSKR